MGEATETALTILVEKMNPYNVNKGGIRPKELGTLCNQGIQSLWKKEFTLEFSRDRKSMSSLCTPLKATKLPPGPKQFVKVRTAIWNCILHMHKLCISVICTKRWSSDEFFSSWTTGNWKLGPNFLETLVGITEKWWLWENLVLVLIAVLIFL